MNEWMDATSRTCGKGLWDCEVCPLGAGPLFHKAVSVPPSFAQNLAACPELLLINHFIGTAGQERTEWVMGVGHRVVDKGLSWHGNNRQTDVAWTIVWALDTSENRPWAIFPLCWGAWKGWVREVWRGCGPLLFPVAGWAGSPTFWDTRIPFNIHILMY